MAHLIRFIATTSRLKGRGFTGDGENPAGRQGPPQPGAIAGTTFTDTGNNSLPSPGRDDLMPTKENPPG